MTQELVPLSLLQRCLTPSALFPLAEQFGGGERDFLYLHTHTHWDVIVSVVLWVLRRSWHHPPRGNAELGMTQRSKHLLPCSPSPGCTSCSSVWNEAEMCMETVIFCTKCSKILLAPLIDLFWMWEKKWNYSPALCWILPVLVSFSCCLEDKLCLPHEKCARLCFLHTPHNEPFAWVVRQAVSARLLMTKWHFNESNGIRHT